MVGSTCTMKLTIGASILPVIKEANKKSVPACVKEITFTKPLDIWLNIVATKGTFKMPKAKIN